MKIRNDFVTNSSSSSFIICFAHVTDEDKVKNLKDITEKFIFTKEEIKDKFIYGGTLGADWAGAEIWGYRSAFEKYPNDNFVVIIDRNDVVEYNDYYEPIYDYDFSRQKYIDMITEENGFDCIEVAEGEGRDG